MERNMIATIHGGKKPFGKVKVSGAKNSATRLLAASLISDGKVQLNNFPTQLVDAKYKIDFIKQNGGSVFVDDDNESILINSENLQNIKLNQYDFPIRTTYLLVPGLIKKSNVAYIPYPGGCKIGNRGYDLHIMVWKALGAQVEEKDDYIQISTKDGFKPGEVNFPISTIGGTENALISASTINGKTIIRNAYISPEIEDLISFLRSMGVNIKVVGNSFIEVIGRKHLEGSVYRVMPDRIEALTWIVYGILSGGDITILDVPFKSMEIPLIHLYEAGIDLFKNSNNVHVTPDCLINGMIQPFEVATGTHPGIISDMQPFFVLLGLHADGISRIFDYRYPERLKYCEQLSHFYKNRIDWERGSITTKGNSNMPNKYINAQSTDLRGSMALVMAALLANGQSTILNIEMALRGYNNLKNKLSGLGIFMQIEEGKYENS